MKDISVFKGPVPADENKTKSNNKKKQNNLLSIWGNSTIKSVL